MATAPDHSLKTGGLLIALAVVFMPCAGIIFVAWNHKPAFHPEYLPLLCLSIAFITGVFLFLYIKNHDHWAVLTSEFKYLIQHGKYAILVGSSLGLISVSVYLLMPSDSSTGAQSQDFERAAAALSLYYGIVGAALGIHTLYLKSAPITEMHELLEMVADDLVRYRKLGNKVLIVFPALNIGYYREIKSHPPRSADQDSIPDAHPYKLFRNALTQSCTALKSDVRVVTFSPDAYGQIYQAYLAEKDAKTPEILALCVQEARQLFEHVTAAHGEAFGLDPAQNRLPPHVIVIGPVSYLIISFAMPKFNASSHEFEVKESNVATLLAYRREDAQFAALICRQVTEELDSAGHLPYTFSVSAPAVTGASTPRG